MTRADWRVRVEPATFVWIALIAVLLLLVALPMTKLLVVSLKTRGGAFTFANYLTAYGRERYVEALVNSLLLATGDGGLSASLFAVPMAWAISRTDMPGKPLIWLIVLGAFILPPVSGRDRLDPAGRPERRLHQPCLALAHRRPHPAG